MKIRHLFYLLPIIVLSACGTGNNITTTNYYTAGNDYSYQVVSVESSIESSAFESAIESGMTLNVLTANGSTIFSAPMQNSGNNSYSIQSQYNGQNINGSVVLSNSILSIAASNWGTDLGSSNTTALQNGTFSTICDKGNISPCSVVIADNNISITEYTTSGQAVPLCQNSQLTATNSFNNNYQFSCGVNASSTPQYTWYMTTFTRNNVPGILISEYNGSSQQNNDETDDIAFPQASTSGAMVYNGKYYYTTNGANSATNPTITTATLTSNGNSGSILNSAVGSCNGQACALTLDEYYSAVANGYAYFTTPTNSVNFNLVGDPVMNMLVDSASGFYLQ